MIRLVGPHSPTYGALHQQYNDLQIEWHQAFGVFSCAQSKFTAHLREMMFSTAHFRFISEALAADVETGSKPDEVSLSFHKPVGFRCTSDLRRGSALRATVSVKDRRMKPLEYMRTTLGWQTANTSPRMMSKDRQRFSLTIC
jgi:hypothetical protein